MNLKDVDIEARNIVFGKVRFLSFKIPEEWRIFPLRMVDIESSKTYRGISWVTDGYIMLGIYSNEGNELLMNIKVSRPLRRFTLKDWMRNKSKDSSIKGTTTLNGHTAGYYVKNITRGLFKKEKLVEMVFCFFCDILERKIEIKLTGKSKDYLALWKEILYSSLKCH